MSAQQYPLIGTSAVIGMFFQELEKSMSKAWISRLCNEFDSTQATETYAGLGLAPMLREWIGGKEPKGFNELGIRVSNRDFEGTLQIMNKDLRRDKTDQLRIRIGSLADRAAAHQQKIASELIEAAAGTSKGVAFDGLSFFNDSHLLGNPGVALDNRISVNISGLPTGGVHGTTSSPAAGELAYAILAGVRQLMSFKDDVGEPQHETMREVTVMVPNGYSDVISSAVNAKILAGFTPNPITSAGSLKIDYVVNPRLTWTTRFALFRTDGRAKPLISQIEYGPTLKALAEGSDYEFENAAQLFSVEKSGAVAYNRFDQAVEVTLT